MSSCRNSNSGTRMCAMFVSDPVSRLSTQMTRRPRRSNSSHRCEPRNPAPPVTRQVAMGADASRYPLLNGARAWPVGLLALARGLQLLLRERGRDDDEPVRAALGQPAAFEPL